MSSGQSNLDKQCKSDTIGTSKYSKAKEHIANSVVWVLISKSCGSNVQKMCKIHMCALELVGNTTKYQLLNKYRALCAAATMDGMSQVLIHVVPASLLLRLGCKYCTNIPYSGRHHLRSTSQLHFSCNTALNSLMLTWPFPNQYVT